MLRKRCPGPFRPHRTGYEKKMAPKAQVRAVASTSPWESWGSDRGRLFSLFGMCGVTGLNIYSLVVAVIGAVVFSVIYHAIRQRIVGRRLDAAGGRPSTRPARNTRPQARPAPRGSQRCGTRVQNGVEGSNGA